MQLLCLLVETDDACIKPARSPQAVKSKPPASTLQAFRSPAFLPAPPNRPRIKH